MKGEERRVNLVSRVQALFQEIFSSLPHGTARLEIQPLEKSRSGGLCLQLKPINPLAAQVSVDVENGDPNVYMWVERESDVIVGIRKAALAIIEGNFEEEIWSVGPNIVKCIGRLTVDGTVHTLRYFGGFYPFRSKEHVTVKYRPYLPAG